LIGHFISAISGGNLYRKSSFLVDSLGKQIFSPNVFLDEQPWLAQGLASAPFDEEGVATRERAIVSAGVVQDYFLGSYSARKLGLRSTGSAGGNHNLILRPGTRDLPALLRQMHRGLFVTELLFTTC
jgi:PmbA protein